MTMETQTLPITSQVITAPISGSSSKATAPPSAMKRSSSASKKMVLLPALPLRRESISSSVICMEALSISGETFASGYSTITTKETAGTAVASTSRGTPLLQSFCQLLIQEKGQPNKFIFLTDNAKLPHNSLRKRVDLAVQARMRPIYVKSLSESRLQLKNDERWNNPKMPPVDLPLPIVSSWSRANGLNHSPRRRSDGRIVQESPRSVMKMPLHVLSPVSPSSTASPVSPPKQALQQAPSPVSPRTAASKSNHRISAVHPFLGDSYGWKPSSGLSSSSSSSESSSSSSSTSSSVSNTSSTITLQSPTTATASPDTLSNLRWKTAMASIFPPPPPLSSSSSPVSSSSSSVCSVTSTKSLPVERHHDQDEDAILMSAQAVVSKSTEPISCRWDTKTTRRPFLRLESDSSLICPKRTGRTLRSSRPYFKVLWTKDPHTHTYSRQLLPLDP